MQWLLKSKTKDIPMSGPMSGPMCHLDWIVLSANALGLAIVLLATILAQGNDTSFAQTLTRTFQEPIETASLR